MDPFTVPETARWSLTTAWFSHVDDIKPTTPCHLSYRNTEALQTSHYKRNYTHDLFHLYISSHLSAPSPQSGLLTLEPDTQRGLQLDLNPIYSHHQARGEHKSIPHQGLLNRNLEGHCRYYRRRSSLSSQTRGLLRSSQAETAVWAPTRLMATVLSRIASHRRHTHQPEYPNGSEAEALGLHSFGTQSSGTCMIHRCCGSVHGSLRMPIVWL